jgi:hypothetical protein
LPQLEQEDLPHRTAERHAPQRAHPNQALKLEQQSFAWPICDTACFSGLCTVRGLRRLAVERRPQPPDPRDHMQH